MEKSLKNMSHERHDGSVQWLWGKIDYYGIMSLEEN